MREPLATRALGRWQDILSSLGVQASVLNGKQQPCPFCGGTDRFIWDNRAGKGTFLCRQCGAGDGVEFVKRFKSIGFKEAATLVESKLGEAHQVAPKIVHDDKAQRAAMTALWKKAQPLSGHDIVCRYLANRGVLPKKLPGALRYINDLAYYEDGRLAGYHPAMVAAYRSPDDYAGQIQRTYLKEPGEKADLGKGAKLLMPGRTPAGGAVRLGPVAETMGIAEGIETALGAMLLHRVPVWAALTAGNLMKWTPPEGCKCVIVFADMDPSFTGQTTAYNLAHRLTVEKFAVEVAFVQFRDNGRIKDDWCQVAEDMKRAKEGQAA